MVLCVTGGHFIAELLEFHPVGEMDAIYFIPASLYFFPVLYASVNFGKEGAIPTAIWCFLLAVPNIILWHHGNERIGEAFQLSTVVVLATIVATRVDREVVARHRAEEQEAALRLSELKYHNLFDNAGQPIIAFDSQGTVHEANAAAGSLFSIAQSDLRAVDLSTLLGENWRDWPTANGHDRWVGREFVLKIGGSEVWLEPLLTRLPTERGLTLALFKDVTAKRGFQSYAGEIVRAQEEERQRISRELHDVSLQRIVLLCRQLDEVEDSADGLLPPEFAVALVEARKLADDIGDELRRFSRDLRPAVLDDLGLVPAIRSLVAELSNRQGIDGRFTFSGAEVRLASECELSLFRICQEALRNVERHSHASRVTVKLSVQGVAARLSVTDNGRGFSVPAAPTHLAARGRLGLLGMQERARLAGGAFRVSSKPGKGTRLDVSLPGTCPGED
jgi:signal transduction histidine kinase